MHYPAYPVIIVSLIIQKNLATKIQAMRESGLTAVRLKWDPPVNIVMLSVHSTHIYQLISYILHNFNHARHIE